MTASLEHLLDIPVPPSVNRTRKVNWKTLRRVDDWHAKADAAVMASGQYRLARQHRRPDKPCEVRIILDEKSCRQDADNPVKAAVDYLRRLELIENDNKQFLRKLTVEWGVAPRGCRIIIQDAA